MPPLIPVFALLALVDLTGMVLEAPVLEWLSKPLLAPVLAWYLWRTTGRRHPLVLVGLGFATAGDVTLQLGDAWFLPGVLCFLGTQVCWTLAFARAGAVGYLRRHRALCACYLAVWTSAVVVLAPALDPALAVALAFYSLALVVMACTANVLGARAAWGGATFVLSDMLIGLDVAGLNFPGRSPLVMATYALALALVVTAFAAHDPEPADGSGSGSDGDSSDSDSDSDSDDGDGDDDGARPGTDRKTSA
ncbi:lysoplasmalogenase [Streptomyces sp. NPDC005438]|uniref:lysoplasmalogenase n=1 Tax=Streptomyces sp. NPDC005438 TaxID=3156880 RepID=UPI0033A994E0